LDANGVLTKDPKIPAAELEARVRAAVAKTAQGEARLKHTGRWVVEDGAIVGGQEPPGSGLGAYLQTEEKFGDFELELDARPDWPIDTGIMVRQHDVGSIGFQVLLDHRPNGGIGGFYGNNTGGFLARNFAVDGDEQPGFRVANLRAGKDESGAKKLALEQGASFDEFMKVWRPDDWNHFRIRCVGRMPVISTWINGLAIAELDTAKIELEGYDPEVIFNRLGREGHIGFEVHDNGKMGHDRWAPGAVCRWRNIMLKAM
jgi:hypothetical protein